MPLAQDVVVVRGAGARRRARLFQVLGGSLVGLGVLFMVFMWRLASLMDSRIAPR
jgi:hypothetical protein